jgi:hypothetical protein
MADGPATARDSPLSMATEGDSRSHAPMGFFEGLPVL